MVMKMEQKQRGKKMQIEMILYLFGCREQRNEIQIISSLI